MRGGQDATSLLHINRTFSALRIPAYRFLWFSMLASFSGMQMQMIARGILAYQIGQSAGAIAIVSIGWGIPMLFFSLIGGTVADRMDRRKLIIISQAATAAVATSIALLVITDYINLWFLFLSGLVQGTVFSFSGPARSAYIPQIVGEKEIMNAIALNSAGMNLTRIVGPSLAGALIAVPWVDVGGVFFIQAALNVVAMAFLLFLPLAGAPPPEVEADIQALIEAPGRRPQRGSMTSDLVDGLRYVLSSPILLTLLMLGLVPSLLVMSYQSFLPIYAKDVFGDGIDRNSAGLGFMMTVTGIGALAGSLVVASLQDYPRRAMLQLASGLGLGVTLTLFAVQVHFGPAIAALVLVGFMGNFFMALNSTMVISASDPDYYGRVMSVNMMTFALMPLGTLPAGFLADLIGQIDAGLVTLVGIQVTNAGAGVLTVAFIFMVTVLNPAYRRLEQDDLKAFAAIAAERVREGEADGSIWQRLRQSMKHQGSHSLAENVADRNRKAADADVAPEPAGSLADAER